MPEKELTVKELFEFVQREKPEGYGCCRLTLYHNGPGKIDTGHGTVVAFSWHDLDELDEKLRNRKRERAVQRVIDAAEAFATHQDHPGMIHAQCIVCKEVCAAAVALGFLR